MQTLDLKGLSCPLPILKLRKATLDAAPGDVIEVLVTDPGALTDFPAFCNQTGHQILTQKTADDVTTFEIKVASGE